MCHIDDPYRVSRQRDFIEELMSRKNAIFNKPPQLSCKRSRNRVQQLKVNNNGLWDYRRPKPDFPAQVNGVFPPIESIIAKSEAGMDERAAAYVGGCNKSRKIATTPPPKPQ